jgi:hypothetical protein
VAFVSGAPLLVGDRDPAEPCLPGGSAEDAARRPVVFAWWTAASMSSQVPWPGRSAKAACQKARTLMEPIPASMDPLYRGMPGGEWSRSTPCLRQSSFTSSVMNGAPLSSFRRNGTPHGDRSVVLRDGLVSLRDLPRLLEAGNLEEHKEFVRAFAGGVKVVPGEARIELQMRTLPTTGASRPGQSACGMVAGARQKSVQMNLRPTGPPAAVSCIAPAARASPTGRR